MRRVSLATLCLLLLAPIASAQTPLSTVNVGARAIKGDASAPNNPWLGAQVGYKLGGSGEFADNLLTSGRVLHEIDVGSTRFVLPVMGNISSLTAAVTDSASAEQLEQKAQQLMLSTQGLNLGLYPYYKAVQREVFTLTVFGGVAWKVNALPDTANATAYLHQARLAVGVEVGLGKPTAGGQRLPLTASVTPTWTLFSSSQYERVFGVRENSMFSLELTGVLPAGHGVGLLAEAVLADQSRSAYRLGLIFVFETT